jgi:hypothetical protein
MSAKDKNINLKKRKRKLRPDNNIKTQQTKNTDICKNMMDM